jgi:hypothetical protein
VVSGFNVAGFATASGRENISLDVPIGDARFLNFPNMQQSFQDDCMTDEYEMRAWVDGQARSCGCVVASA